MEKTSRHFHEQLDRISEGILRMGGMVEEAIGKSIRALTDRDSSLAREVIESDAAVDQLELELDRLCIQALGLQQPMARDLRFLTTTMKIVPDLERIADHAANVAERVLELNEEPEVRTVVDLPLMARRAQAMVRGALDALVQRDPEAAKAVIEMDDEVDRRMEEIFRELLSFMERDPGAVARAMRLSFVAKYFERIGDQATNICEQIVFMAEGEVIKHHGLASEDREDAGA